MPLPEAFDGAMKNVDGFIASCGLYMGARNAEFTTEQSRINWILSFCTKGAALDWRQSEMELGRVTGRMSFATAAELEDEIQRRFGDTDRVATKIIHLRTIKQGDRIAEEHIQDFRKAAIGSGYEGRALIEEFKQGLNQPLRERIMMSENVPVTIEDWYNKALLFDRNYRNMIAEKKLYGGMSSGNRGPGPFRGGQPARANAPQAGANFGGPPAGQRGPAFPQPPPYA
ncbi:hypothetical protein M378DRAFT_91356 [Amanita muscaria Koide BX008]|uniref:Retrotransposon gag domain-containing protein n=1 Tax=Amanita muscaria (strain Koide BX008) TaxID=946122 RepID=A0A0C2RXU7_AMAMK|nr:hypothetical protein M378DRAFT_91356 [Amanita muscaria Koide BX008]